MENENIRIVRFFADQRGACEDLYRTTDKKTVFIRQECDDDHVYWLTSSKWTGGYEADCHLKEGLVMRVVDGHDKVLFEETIEREDGYSYTTAKKEGPFSWEAIYALAAEIEKQNQLQPYEEWKSWLLADKPGENNDYPENWLFATVDYGPYKKLAKLDFLGVSVFATVREAKHRVCGKVWRCYEIQDSKLMSACGFRFEK